MADYPLAPWVFQAVVNDRTVITEVLSRRGLMRLLLTLARMFVNAKSCQVVTTPEAIAAQCRWKSSRRVRGYLEELQARAWILPPLKLGRDIVVRMGPAWVQAVAAIEGPSDPSDWFEPL